MTVPYLFSVDNKENDEHNFQNEDESEEKRVLTKKEEK